MFKVEIIELSSKLVTVNARTQIEAELIARAKYKEAKEGFVLTAEDFLDVDFKVYDKGHEVYLC